jgi:four helix bundle protein
MGGKGFRDLLVWQKSKELAVHIYKISNQGELNKDYGLRDQIRRSAVSISSNIAEGDERDTNKESIRFLYIAKGSLAELRTQLEIAYEIGYIEKRVYSELENVCDEIGRMTGKLIKARQQ